MRKGLLLLLILFMLVIAGCSSFSTIKAMEYVGDCYSLICPGGSKSHVLATKPYKNGILVLAKNSTGQDIDTLELFFVGKDGVNKLSTGIVAGEGEFSLNRLLDGNNSILFGQFAVDSKDNTKVLKYTKVLITLKNWKTLEEEITDEKGFILILNHTENVEKFDLYGAEGTILARINDIRLVGPGLHQTAFVSISDYPLPFPLIIDNVNEVRVEKLVRLKNVNIVLANREDYQELVRVVNENFKSLVRIVHLPNPNLEVFFTVQSGEKIIVRRVSSSLYIVSFQKGEQVSHYLLNSDDLTEIVNGLENKLAEKMAEENKS